MRTALRWIEHILAVVGALALVSAGVEYASKRPAMVATVQAPENMVRTTAMLTAKQLERLDAVGGAGTMAKVMWQAAMANPDATAVCMVVLRAKDGAVNKYGHPLTEDQRLAVVIERNAEEIRKYSDGEVYLRADNWKVYSRYVTILQKARDKPSEVDCPN